MRSYCACCWVSASRRAVTVCWADRTWNQACLIFRMMFCREDSALSSFTWSESADCFSEAAFFPPSMGEP